MPITSNEPLYQTTEVLTLLGIPLHKLAYLFDSGKLHKKDFMQSSNGRRFFRESDISRIKIALFDIANKSGKQEKVVHVES